MVQRRRAAGEGSIRLRSDGRWEGRYVAGRDANGKLIRKNVLGKTQAEAKEKLNAALAEAKVIDVAKADEYTVKSWVQTWYEVYSRPHIRDSTRRFYERYMFFFSCS